MPHIDRKAKHGFDMHGIKPVTQERLHKMLAEAARPPHESDDNEQLDFRDFPGLRAPKGYEQVLTPLEAPRSRARSSKAVSCSSQEKGRGSEGNGSPKRRSEKRLVDALQPD